MKNDLYSIGKKYGYITIVIGLLLILIAAMSFMCYGSSIHGDEYFSISFANNAEKFLFLSKGQVERLSTNHWLKADVFHDMLSVQGDSRFAIMEIHRNVRHDVHPPLYFMLLNCISSFFIDEVTFFPGYLINVLSGIVICMMMYLIMRKIFKDKWIAVIPPVFWVLSQAGYDTMTYIRMYAPLCALVLICLYLHMLYFEEEFPKWWLYVLLLGCTTVGTLTHYYYYVMQLVLFIVVVITLVCYKKVKKLLGYGISLLSGEIISLLAYPYVFKHLLSSDRGVQVQENLVNTDFRHYIEHFKAFMNTINRSVYNNYFVEIFLAFIICLIAVFVIKSLIKKEIVKVTEEKTNSIFAEKGGKNNFILMIIVAAGYFAILFKISYSSAWFYISPIFPLLAMITVGCFVLVIGRSPSHNYGLWMFIIAVIFLIAGVAERIEDGINQHEIIEEQHEKIVAYSNNCDVLFFYRKWDTLYDCQILELMDFDQIRGISVDDMENADYQEVLEARLDSDNLVIYIPVKTENYQEKIEKIAATIGSTKPILISEDKYAVYFLNIRE